MEIRLLSDPEFGEEFDVAVNELTDRYVAGEVQGAEREEMERYFFAAPARREKLRIAQALKARKQQIERGKRWLPSKELRIAASILIVFGLTYGVWWTTRNWGGPSGSEMDKGLLALQSAYREQRAIPGRISDLPHADFSQTRGRKLNTPVQEDLRRAELHLSQATKDAPSPEAHHLLGKVYLVQGNLDGAIKEFEESVKGTPNNAQIYNDLGVAWMEKGELNRSLESFNKALQLDGNSLDALFNRALCYEKLSRTEEAKADWREYLKRDPSSPWANEARQKLETMGSE